MAIMSLAIASDTNVGCPLSWITTRLAVPPVARQSARQRSQNSSNPNRAARRGRRRTKNNTFDGKTP